WRRLFGILEQGQVGVVGEAPVSLLSGHLAQQPELLKLLCQFVCVREGYLQGLLDRLDGNHRPFVQRFKERQSLASSTTQLVDDQRAVLLSEVHDLSRRLRRLLGDLENAPQEELDPPLPVATITDRLESI